MSKRVLIIGGGVIGLCTAYYCAQRGFTVTVLERNSAQRDGCSFGNAGLVVPSHFVPLAAPGAVVLALKWMWNPASPFYLKPRLSWDLFSWSMRFWRAANAEHVRRAAPLLRDLSLASRACYEELAGTPVSDPGRSDTSSATSRVGDQRSGISDFGLVKKGLLVLCKETRTLDEEAKTAEQARSLGIPAEVLDAKQTAARDPDVRMDVAGSVYYPMDGSLIPDRFMAVLQQQCEQAGVNFVWDCVVVNWKMETAQASVSGARLPRRAKARQRDGGCEPQETGLQTRVPAGHRPALQSNGRCLRAIITSQGNEIEADEFVLCAGSWSPQLGRGLGLKIPLQAGKGYSLTLQKPRQLPHLCSLLSEARVAVTPMGDALRVGGTMEIAGLNEDINSVRVRGIAEAFCRYFPEFRHEDFNGVPPWRGLRPCSPDGLPFVGRTQKFRNLSLATGHAMMGMSLGPITGKLMAEILSGEKPAWDIHQLSPDRYG